MAALIWVVVGSVYAQGAFVFAAMMFTLLAGIVANLEPRRDEPGIWMLSATIFAALSIPIVLDIRSGGSPSIPASDDWFHLDLRFGLLFFACSYLYTLWFTLDYVIRQFERRKQQ